MFKARLDTALNARVAATPAALLQLGDEVLMYRKNFAGKWVGLYVVQRINHDKELPKLDTGNHFVIASVEKVKRYNIRND